MEFNEKLQQLRKSKNLTQEELAEVLYVSRTAVSKWESGRGYPNIESLKDISSYFSVSIDDLLSGEELIMLAEKENKSEIRAMYDLMLGLVDMLSLLLVILPLYPDKADNYIYSVSLPFYTQTSKFNITVYWILFVSLFLLGIIKVALARFAKGESHRIITDISMVLNVLAVMFLALTRQAYALIMVFVMLLVKGIFIFNHIKKGK